MSPSWAAVINVLVSSLGFYWPSIGAGVSRAALITTIIVLLTAINIRGIRLSSFVVNLLTVGKLLPLSVFVVAGIFFVDWSRLLPGPLPTVTALSSSGLLLIYAFGGYEVVPVPGGESRNPRRDIPFALIMTIVIVAVLMTLAQIVSVGTFPQLAESKTPLADSAAVFLGAAGAAMITLGAVISATGNNMGGAISGSRNLFALAEQGDLPASLRAGPSHVSDPGCRHSRHVRSRAGARALRNLSVDGDGERDQQTRSLCRHLCVGAPSPQPSVSGSRQSRDVRRSLRSTHTTRSHVDRADHSGWCIDAAASQRCARASRRCSPLRHRRTESAKWRTYRTNPVDLERTQ